MWVLRQEIAHDKELSKDFIGPVEQEERSMRFLWRARPHVAMLYKDGRRGV